MKRIAGSRGREADAAEMSQREVAAVLGLSNERVCRIERRAFKKLRCMPRFEAVLRAICAERKRTRPTSLAEQYEAIGVNHLT